MLCLATPPPYADDYVKPALTIYFPPPPRDHMQHAHTHTCTCTCTCICTRTHTHTHTHAHTANFPLLEYEELVLNTLAALNNLSYYAQADSSILARQEEMAKCKQSLCTYVHTHAYTILLASLAMKIMRRRYEVTVWI